MLDSCTHAVGFHYETYGEISPSRTIPYTAQFDFAILERYLYEKMHTASPNQAFAFDVTFPTMPKGSGLMW